MAKVIDCFPFYNETEVLQARLELLAGTVNLHIAVEARQTHQGDPKPLYLDGIDLPPNVHRIAVELPAGDDHWVRERHQRDALGVRLRMSDIDPDDLILSCDVDEIPDPDRIDAIAEASQHGPVRLGMRMLYYGLDWEYGPGWGHPVAFRARDIPESLSELRLRPGLPVLGGCGWHVSYWGGRDRRREKLHAYAHAENLTNGAAERILVGEGIGPNGEPLQPVDRATLPPLLVKLLG